MNYIWTPEREAKAFRLYVTEGRSAEETARLIGGVSRHAIIGKAHRRGWMKGHRQRPMNPAPPRYSRAQVTFTEEMDARLREMAKEGITKANAARRLDVSPSRLSDRVAALGLDWKEPAKRTEIERTIARPSAPRPTIVQADADAKTAFEVPANDDAIPLIGRPFGSCAWPVGTPDQPANQLCCGQRTDPGSSMPYCSRHRAIAGNGRIVNPTELARSIRRWAA